MASSDEIKGTGRKHFKPSWRGYDKQQVDEHISQLYTWLEDFQNRVRAAEDEASSLRVVIEQHGAPVAPSGLNPTQLAENVRRILEEAYRTADTILAEARAAASSLGDRQVPKAAPLGPSTGSVALANDERRGRRNGNDRPLGTLIDRPAEEEGRAPSPERSTLSAYSSSPLSTAS